MSAPCEVTAEKSHGSRMGFFERYLTVWAFLCIITGIVNQAPLWLVGVLIEVPVMLSIVKIINYTQGWYGPPCQPISENHE